TRTTESRSPARPITRRPRSLARNQFATSYGTVFLPISPHARRFGAGAPRCRIEIVSTRASATYVEPVFFTNREPVPSASTTHVPTNIWGIVNGSGEEGSQAFGPPGTEPLS